MRALALVLMLAGCGGGSVVSDNEGVTANQIERVSTPKKEEAVDPNAAARLQPLARRDLDPARLAGAGCAFGKDGRMLLAVTPGDAVARIGGAVVHLVHSVPAGPTGGFFEDRQLSISVGRTDTAAAAQGGTGAWPARITVTNRRTGAQTELEGVWRCGG